MLDENIKKLSSEETNEDSQKSLVDEKITLDKDLPEKKLDEIKEADLEKKTSPKEDNLGKEGETKEEKDVTDYLKIKEENKPVKEIIDIENSEKEKQVDEKEENKDKNVSDLKSPELAEEIETEDNNKTNTVVEKEEGDTVSENNEIVENNEVVDEKETVEEGSVDQSKDKKTVETRKKMELPIVDFVKLTLEELIEHFRLLLDNFSVHETRTQVESLKSNFIKKFKEILSEKKREFIDGGGNEIDFHFNLPVKNSFNDLVFEYKKKRRQYYKDLESEQSSNLEKRLELIEDLKSLIDNAEASTMYKNFRVLQDKWRVIGQIPHTKYNDVWRTYHHHVERFYDLLHLNNDFRDLDFKHNLEEKTKLAEIAEKLANDKDVNHAFKELQVLHRMWKEDIGPVARELREDIWSRFSEATMKIHQKRHDYQDKLDEKLNDNIALKIAVIDKIKTINIEGITSHKSWQDSIKKLESLRDDFFAVGRVPKSKNEEIWQLFKDATRVFNKAKNNFYKSIKKDQSTNLKKKMDLVDQAEKLKDSDDWEMVTDIFKKIQSDWKSIGHVPSRDSDKIWKRFKNACNHYFDRLHDKQDGANKEQTEVFNTKKDFLEQFKVKLDNEDSLTIEMVNENITNWRNLGTVPMKMRHIDTKFNKLLDLAYKKLNIDKEEAIFLKFKNIIDSYVEQKDERRIDSERLFVRRKMDELTKEIKQLENNISFISNASEDNPLVKNVYKNIENYKNELEVWKRKIFYLNKLDI